MTRMSTLPADFHDTNPAYSILSATASVSSSWNPAPFSATYRQYNRRSAATTMARLAPISSPPPFQQGQRSSLTGGRQIFSRLQSAWDLPFALVNGRTLKVPLWFTWPNARARAQQLTAPPLIGSRSPRLVSELAKQSDVENRGSP